MTSVCVKISKLQTLGYSDLEHWLSNPDNMYVGSAGRIFITDKKTNTKKIFHYEGSKWKNPFNLKKYTIKESLQRYSIHLFTSKLIFDVDELRGKNLGCYCHQDRTDNGVPMCHTQILEDLLSKCYHIIEPYIKARKNERKIGKLRVGGQKRRVGYAHKTGFTNLAIISRGPAPWKELSPFFLGPVYDPKTGLQAENIENFWQFMKVYPKVAKQRICRGKGEKRYVEWQWPSEIHAKLKPGGDSKNFDDWKVLPKWEKWRNSGFTNKYAIRRPNGTVKKNGPPIFALYNGERLGYIESRKKIYIPTYGRMFKEHRLFKQILDMLKNGKNIMLIDVDGPDVVKYPEGLEMSLELIEQLTEDTRRPLGHGFVAAKVLLEAILEK